jgi:hypothetical protein
MNWGGLNESFKAIWEDQPRLLLFLVFGFIVFVFIVGDVWRHKHRRRRKGKGLHRSHD